MLTANQEFLDNYLALRSVSEGTRAIYMYALLSWDTYTQKPLTQLDRDSLLTWFTKARQELSASTLERYSNTLRLFHTHELVNQGTSKRIAKAQSAELFDLIPFKDLRKTAKKDTELKDKIVTPEEFQTLMRASQSVRFRALLAITYDSGCRKGEILSLKLKDIKIKPTHWEITVSGKTGVRTVPLTESIPYVRAWMDIHPDKANQDSLLFVTTRGGKVKPMHDKSFNTGLRDLCKQTGLRNIHPHMLRHTKLTELAEDSNIGDFQMKSFAGWTPDSNMAARYLHLTGKGHMNAVLGAKGVDTNGSQVEVNPLLSMDKCPNCGTSVDPTMVQCPNPACNHVLRSQSIVEEQSRIKELEQQVAELTKQNREILEIMKKLVK